MSKIKSDSVHIFCTVLAVN